MMNRSPFFYVGDKFKLMKQLNELFPEKIGRLVEPFVGGGSVFLNTESDNYIVNDLNEYMIGLHKFLYSYKGKREVFIKSFENKILEYNLSASYLGKTVPYELKKKHIKTYYAIYNKEAYKNVRNDFNNDKSNYLLLYILLIYGFNHMLRFNNSGDFNLPVGNVDYNKNVFNALNGYFDFIENHNIKFYSKDFETFLLKLRYNKDNDFVYVDPPYLISDSEYNKYWTDEDEKRLLKVLDILDKKGVKFALSNVLEHKGKENLILKEWSKKYRVINIKSNYISFNDNTIKSTTKEVLIVNYGRV